MSHTKLLMKWYNKHNPKFKEYFNFDMPFDEEGIDIIKLEGIFKLHGLEHETVKDFVERKYGKEASMFIIDLIFTNYKEL